MKVVMHVSDRIIVLHGGQILAEGTTAEIRTNERMQQTLPGNSPVTAARPERAARGEAAGALLLVDEVHTHYSEAHILEGGSRRATFAETRRSSNDSSRSE